MKEEKYYMTNGKGVEPVKGIILIGKEIIQKVGEIRVLDEFGNGAGWEYFIKSEEVIEISKQNYDYLKDCVFNWTDENATKHQNKVHELLKKSA